MDNLRIRLLACLCLWIISVQGMVAYTLTPEAIQVEDNSDLEYKEATGPGLVYINQIHILKIESAQQKIPLLPFPLSTSISLNPEKEETNAIPYEFSQRDHKYGLKTLIFPFHFFW